MSDVGSASPPAVIIPPQKFKNINANMLLEKHGMHSDMDSVDDVNQLVIGHKSDICYEFLVAVGQNTSIKRVVLPVLLRHLADQN